MRRSMTEAKREWCKSTHRQMELSGYEPTEVLLAAFDRYVKDELTFHQLCVVMRDEGE
jgi:hypothetical protein